MKVLRSLWEIAASFWSIRKKEMHFVNQSMIWIKILSNLLGHQIRFNLLLVKQKETLNRKEVFDWDFSSFRIDLKIERAKNRMGGHGGLNILPQKRWNVYNHDNREKVDRDKKRLHERRN